MNSTKLQCNCDEFRKHLYDLWLADKYCDVTLIAADGETRVSAHRLVLESTNPYFAEQVNENQEIYIDKVDGNTLKILVGVCYSGILEVDETNISRLYMGAVNLQLHTLLQVMDKHILSKLNASNSLHFRRLAECLSRSELLKATEKYICVHFIEISERPSFLQLEASYLNKIIALEDLQVPSAEVVFRKVVKWLEYDSDQNRRADLLELLPNLRLNLMSPKFLMEQVRPYCETAELKEGILDALDAHLKSVLSAVRRDQLLLVVHIGSGKEAEIMEYSFERQLWKTISTLPTPIYDFSVHYCKGLNSLCFVGGFFNDVVCDVLLWNLQTHKFTNTVSMLEARSHAGVVSLKQDDNDVNDIIVVAGMGSRRSLSSVERWSHREGKWRSLEPALDGKYGARLIKVDNFIYSIGGWGSNGSLIKALERYDVVKNEWSLLAPLHHERYECAVMSEDGKLYVIGGRSDVIECYDPEKDKWTEVCVVEDSWFVGTCVRYQNRLYAFGQNKVIVSEGDWSSWSSTDTIPAIDEYIYAGFAIPQFPSD